MEDLTFIYKYLGVIGVSKPVSMDKGRSYLYQLVKTDPKAELFDMYTSERIDSIFTDIKNEYHVRKAYLEKQNASQPKSSQVLPRKVKKKDNSSDSQNNNHKWIWWCAGGATVAGVVTIFLLLSGDQSTEIDGGEISPQL
ncbi:MAG: hypothetical protein HQK83_12590 [Fibrobacteria bacterium]|nr:hypothetical protein [Fibrobacteria bacterium]